MADAATTECCPNRALLLLWPVDTVEPRTACKEELLWHNYPPLNIELSTFRKIAEDTHVTLKDLDLKIVQVREILESLRSEQQQAQ